LKLRLLQGKCLGTHQIRKGENREKRKRNHDSRVMKTSCTERETQEVRRVDRGDKRCVSKGENGTGRTTRGRKRHQIWVVLGVAERNHAHHLHIGSEAREKSLLVLAA